MTFTQLTLPLDVPAQPQPVVGDRVRMMLTGLRRDWPGAPIETSVRVCDGELINIVYANEMPSGQGFKPRSMRSKYDRWVVKVARINGAPVFRYGSQNGYRIEVFPMNKTTKGFLYDLFE